MPVLYKLKHCNNAHQSYFASQVSIGNMPHPQAAFTEQPHYTGGSGLQLKHGWVVGAKFTDAGTSVDVPVDHKTFAAPRHTAQLQLRLQHQNIYF